MKLLFFPTKLEMSNCFVVCQVPLGTEYLQKKKVHEILKSRRDDILGYFAINFKHSHIKVHQKNKRFSQAKVDWTYLMTENKTTAAGFGY